MRTNSPFILLTVLSLILLTRSRVVGHQGAPTDIDLDLELDVPGDNAPRQLSDTGVILQQPNQYRRNLDPLRSQRPAQPVSPAPRQRQRQPQQTVNKQPAQPAKTKPTTSTKTQPSRESKSMNTEQILLGLKKENIHSLAARYKSTVFTPEYENTTLRDGHEYWRSNRGSCRSHFTFNDEGPKRNDTLISKEGGFTGRSLRGCPFESAIRKNWACLGREDELLRYRLRSPCCKNKEVDFPFESVLSCIKGKNIIFIGDSLMRNFYYTYSCLVHLAAKKAGLEINLISSPEPRIGLPRAALGNVVTINRIKTTISYLGSFETLLFPVLIHHTVNYYLDKGVVFDVIVASSGHHWYKDRVYDPQGYQKSWSHVAGVMQRYQREVYKKTGEKPFFIARGVPPRHFQHAEWDSGGTCYSGEVKNNATTDVNGTINDSNTTMRYQYTEAAEMSELIRTELMNLGEHSGFLDITDISQARGDSTVGAINLAQYDCTHYCILGAPLAWSTLFQRMMCSGINGTTFSPMPYSPLCGNCSSPLSQMSCSRLEFE